MKAWIARDKDGSLWLFESVKPWKETKKWFNRDYYDMHEIASELFPEIAWEDDEPTEVEIQIVKK